MIRCAMGLLFASLSLIGNCFLPVRRGVQAVQALEFFAGRKVNDFYAHAFLKRGITGPELEIYQHNSFAGAGLHVLDTCDFYPACITQYRRVRIGCNRLRASCWDSCPKSCVLIHFTVASCIIVKTKIPRNHMATRGKLGAGLGFEPRTFRL